MLVRPSCTIIIQDPKQDRMWKILQNFIFKPTADSKNIQRSSEKEKKWKKKGRI
jgi:hypothetical protein